MQLELRKLKTVPLKITNMYAACYIAACERHSDVLYYLVKRIEEE